MAWFIAKDPRESRIRTEGVDRDCFGKIIMFFIIKLCFVGQKDDEPLVVIRPPFLIHGDINRQHKEGYPVTYGIDAVRCLAKS